LSPAKTGASVLIPTHANAYSGTTTVAEGELDVQDSAALGSSAAGTVVNDGAALELVIDDVPDSVTGTTNTMRFSEPLTITGNGDGNGALLSASGINVWAGAIALTGSVASIGVSPDFN